MSQRLKIILPIGIVLAGLLGSLALVRAKRPVETGTPARPVPAVRVVTVEPREVRLDVTAQGTVLPRTETTLAAEVAGRVVAVAPAFEVGGFVARGEALVSLDSRPYELAIRRGSARVAQAKLRLAQQQAEARVAAHEWQQLEAGEADPLVLREPQIAEAAAALEAAEAEVEMARLDLEHCAIRVPFDGRVSRKAVDLGQYLTPGQPVAALDAIDFAEVRLPVADRQLAFLDLPLTFRDGDESTAGPEVVLSARFAGQRLTWRGRIVRTEGEIDARSRMLHLVARVEDPYGRRSGLDQPPLAVGLFVEAEIAGHSLKEAIRLPRSALHGGERVLIVDPEDRLRWRNVRVVRIQGDSAVVGDGLAAGERVCVSRLDVVVEGMRVLPVESEPETETGASGSEETRPTAAPAVAAVASVAAVAADEPMDIAAGASGRLRSVAFLGDGEPPSVKILVSGDYTHSTFRLTSPERFVIDLAGVVAGSPHSLIAGAGAVDQVRVSQHQVVPEPVLRVVLDLRQPVVPKIIRESDGLRISWQPSNDSQLDD